MNINDKSIRTNYYLLHTCKSSTSSSSPENEEKKNGRYAPLPCKLNQNQRQTIHFPETETKRMSAQFSPIPSSISPLSLTKKHSLPILSPSFQLNGLNHLIERNDCPKLPPISTVGGHSITTSSKRIFVVQNEAKPSSLILPDTIPHFFYSFRNSENEITPILPDTISHSLYSFRYDGDSELTPMWPDTISHFWYSSCSTCPSLTSSLKSSSSSSLKQCVSSQQRRQLKAWRQKVIATTTHKRKKYPLRQIEQWEFEDDGENLNEMNKYSSDDDDYEEEEEDENDKKDEAVDSLTELVNSSMKIQRPHIQFRIVQVNRSAMAKSAATLHHYFYLPNTVPISQPILCNQQEIRRTGALSARELQNMLLYLFN